MRSLLLTCFRSVGSFYVIHSSVKYPASFSDLIVKQDRDKQVLVYCRFDCSKTERLSLALKE